MAYKKTVQGRSYPFLYNVTMTVGSRKSVSHNKVSDMQAAPNSGMGQMARQQGGQMARQQTQPVTKFTASYEPNKRDDVMLVQYLLKRIYQQGQNANPPLNQSNGTAQLKIDGLYGPKTQKAIEQFQLEMRRNGRNIATDGSVDPERGDSSTASISHTGYTISWLNKYFWLLYPSLAPDLRVDPECPMELKQSLSNV